MIANLTKVWGPHTAKAGIYYQHSAKPQAAFANWNGNINFTDNANNPYDTGFGYANAAHRGLQQLPAGEHLRDAVLGRTTTSSSSLQDNWKVGKPDARLRRAVLLHDAAVGHATWASATFLPDEFNAAAAAKLYHAGVHRQLSRAPARRTAAA